MDEIQKNTCFNLEVASIGKQRRSLRIELWALCPGAVQHWKPINSLLFHSENTEGWTFILNVALVFSSDL